MNDAGFVMVLSLVKSGRIVTVQKMATTKFTQRAARKKRKKVYATMIDFIGALLGRRTCGWCRAPDENWLERWLGKVDTPLKKTVWWVYFKPGEVVPVWKLGACIHFRFHYDRPQDRRSFSQTWESFNDARN